MGAEHRRPSGFPVARRPPKCPRRPTAIRPCRARRPRRRGRSRLPRPPRPRPPPPLAQARPRCPGRRAASARAPPLAEPRPLLPRWRSRARWRRPTPSGRASASPPNRLCRQRPPPTQLPERSRRPSVRRPRTPPAPADLPPSSHQPGRSPRFPHPPTTSAPPRGPSRNRRQSLPCPSLSRPAPLRHPSHKPALLPAQIPRLLPAVARRALPRSRNRAAAARAETRAPGAALKLPANPFSDLGPEDLASFVDCTLFEMDTGAEGASSDESPPRPFFPHWCPQVRRRTVRSSCRRFPCPPPSQHRTPLAIRLGSRPPKHAPPRKRQGAPRTQ